MFYVPISLLADVSPVFHNFTDKPPPWSFTRPPGVSEVCHLPDVDSSALALVLSLIINPDEDDGWVDESTIAGNAAFDLFLDCIHVALLYRLPFIGRLWDIIHANKDTFLVCPFLRCFLACATQNDDMVRQYAWRTLPLKLSDIHPQLKEMWKTYMPHAFVEFARFHKQFHGPAVRMIKALRSSAIPGRNIGHFSKMCRRPEDQVLIDEHACRTIVEYEHDWQRARDAAARYLTAYLFTGWVDWEALVWTYARISFVIEESSETKWCGRCQKNLANIFYNIVVKRFGVDLAIVEEARHDRPLFHVCKCMTARGPVLRPPQLSLTPSPNQTNSLERRSGRYDLVSGGEE
jgi:hypothetical protein